MDRTFQIWPRATLALAVLSVALALGGCSGFGNTDHTVFHKAQLARTAIRHGDFAQAAKLANQMRAASRPQDPWHDAPFAAFIAYVGAPADAKFAAELDAWVAAQPKAELPWLVRASYRNDMAWWIRGDAYNDHVQSSHMARFQQEEALAATDIATAIRLAPRGRYARFVNLLIAKSNADPATQEAAFTQAIAVFPTYYPLYVARLDTLRPKWGGSVDAMKAFVAHYAGAAPGDSPLRMLYLNLYADLLSAAAEHCDDSDDNFSRSQCVELTMGQIAGPQLARAASAAVQTFARPDDLQATSEVAGYIETMIDTCGGSREAMHFLQLAATALHSDTQLIAADTAHNNFMIDRLAARFWDRQRTYVNAVKLDQRALRDLANTHFPSATDAAFARAGIEQELMATYHHLGNQDEIVAHGAKAAHLLGGYGAAPYYDRMACYAQFLLHRYRQAVTTCSAIIAASNDAEAREDRAEALEKLHRDREASADYRIVANSGTDVGYRTYAAIAIGVLDANAGDNRSALKDMNDFSSLFVPGLASHDSLAVYFNNRCYYKMQLGDLQSALDDCDTSLTYGTLPDALAKQEKLEQALGKH